MARSLRDLLLARSPAVPAVAPQQPAPLTGAQIDEQNAAAYRQNLAQTSPFVSGLKEGTTNLEGSVEALAGLGQGAVGDVQGGRSRLRRAATTLQQAQDYSTPETADLAAAYKSGNLLRYAEHQIGALTPGIAATVVPAAVTGGAGALVQGGLRRLAFGAAEDVAGGVAKKAAQNTLGRVIGEQVGAIGSGAAQMAGTTAGAVDPNASDEQFQAQSRKALAGAGGLGALMALPGVALLHRYGVGAGAEAAIAKRLGAPLYKRVLREGAEQAAIGGGTGAALVAAEHATHDWITGHPSAAPALPDYINALAAGSLGGAVFGAPAGLKGARGKGFAERASGLRATLEQRFKDVQAKRVKPGEEIPLDGGKSATEHFDDNLTALRDDDMPLKGKAFNVSKDNLLNGPAASLVDPARQRARDAYFEERGNTAFAGIKSPTEKLVASMLDDGQYSADAIPGIKATAKAIRVGWDKLNPKELNAVSEFHSRLPEDKRQLFANALTTANDITSRSGYAGLKDASEIPSLRKQYMTDENGQPLLRTDENGQQVKIPVSEDVGSGNKRTKASGLSDEVADPIADPGMRDRAGLSTQEKDAPLGYVDPDTWAKAQYFKKRGGPARGTPDEENVRMVRFNKDGESYSVDFNMKQAASSLAKSEEGKALLNSQGGPSRRVKAVMGVLTEALDRGSPIHRGDIREGLRVFPGEDGVLNAKEAAYVQKAMAKRYEGTPGVIETKGRAEPKSTLDLPQTNEVQTAEGDLAARQDDQYKLGPDPKKVRGEERAIETTARKAAQAAGVPTRVNGRARPPGDIYEHLLRRAKDTKERGIAMAAIRRLSETDPALAEHISEAHDKLDAFKARQKKAAAATTKPKETLKTLEAEVPVAEKYATSPPKDFTVGEARQRAARMDEIYAKAKAKAAELGTGHAAYGRLDDLLSVAKTAADALRHVADQQEAAEKHSPEQYKADNDLYTNNASGESSASVEAINRLRDEKAAGQSRMLVDRDGSVRPLFGVDAVDTFARPGQIIVQRGIGKEPWTVISDGTGSKELAQGKLNAARRALEAEHADLMADADKDVPKGSAESERRAAAIAMARDLGIKNPEHFVDLATETSLAEKDHNAVTRDPVTGKDFTAKQLMEQLASEGKPDLGDEFSRRRGYTPEEIARYHEYQRAAAEAIRDAGEDNAAHVHGVADGSLDIPAPFRDDGKPPVQRSIEKVKASKGYQQVAKLVERVVRGGNDRVKERQLVNRLSKAFGVDALPVVEHQGGPAGKYDGKVISLRSDLKGAQRLSTMFHEFGHHLAESKWAGADEKTKAALEADYQAWLKANGKKTNSFEVRASRAPFFVNERILDALGGERAASMKELPADKVAYLLSRDEYFADSIARALEQHEGVQGLVGKFFAKLAQTLKLTYDLLRGTDPKLADTPAAIKEWVHSLWSAQDPDLAAPAAKRDAPELRTAAGEAPRPAFNTPSDTSTLLSPEDRGVLASFMLRKGTMAQLLEGASPEMARRLLSFGTQLDAAVNRGFALWATGKLKLVDKRTLAVLHELRDVVKKTFGFVTDKQVAERVLADLKAGRYDPKESTRRVLENEARAGFRTRINAGDTNAKIEMAIHKAVTKTTHLVHDKLGPIYERVFNDLDHRIRAANVPALRQLADLVHRQTGERGEGETLTQSIARNRAKLWDQATKLTEGLSLRDQAKLIKALRTKTTLDGPLEKRRQTIAKFMGDMHHYLEMAGVEVGHIKDYWPVVVDPRKIQNREADFRAMLSDPKLEAGMRAYFKSKGWDTAKMTQKEMVDAMYRMAASEFDYSQNGISFADGLLPGGREFRTRVSEFIYRTGDAELINKFAKFQSGNLEQTLIPYITHAVRRAESQRRLGAMKDDVNGSPLEQLLDKAKQQGAGEEQIQLAKDYVNAALGSYGTGPNPFFQKALGAFDRVFDTKLGDMNSAQYRKLSNAIIAYQNLRVLGLGLFGNLVDPLGVWVRSSSASQTWTGYKAAMKAAFAKGDNHLADMAHVVGAVERHALGEALAYNYGGTGDDLNSLSMRVNRALFRVNGMESITRFARLAATETANKFLLRHANDPTAHSARYLDELGLKPSDIKEDPEHPGYVKLNAKVEKAIYQFVDESVLRPVATQRPLWHNDPHLAVLAQYKGYLYSFYNTVVQRMLHEAHNGNFRGLMPIVGYMGVTMAAEMIREMVQYGTGGNPRRKDWDAADYLALSADRSGLLGPKLGILEDSLTDVERGNIPGQSITGPAVSQAGELLKTVAGRRSFDTTAVHALPGQSIYKGWLSHGDTTGDAAQPGDARALAGT